MRRGFIEMAGYPRGSDGTASTDPAEPGTGRDPALPVKASEPRSLCLTAPLGRDLVCPDVVQLPHQVVPLSDPARMVVVDGWARVDAEAGTVN